MKIPSLIGKIQKNFPIRYVDKKGLTKYDNHVLKNSTPREWRRQNSPIRIRKGDNKMNKRDFNVVGNEGTDNQELAKGIAFVKSRRAELNVVQMVENMRDQAILNGVIINDVYCDRSMTRDYDREALNAFFATLKEEDFEVVVVRSLNEITDDIYDLEEFVKTITDIWAYGSILLKSVRCQLLYLMQRTLDANGVLW